jgi:hypothetical protein
MENATALGHDVLEIGEGREVLVGEGLIEDGPEAGFTHEALAEPRDGRVCRGRGGSP